MNASVDMTVQSVLDGLSGTYALSIDRKRRMTWVSDALMRVDQGRPNEYDGKKGTSIWTVDWQSTRRAIVTLRHGIGVGGYEIWRPRDGRQYLVKVTRIPTEGGALIIGEDRTELAVARVRALLGERRPELTQQEADQLGLLIEAQGSYPGLVAATGATPDRISALLWKALHLR